MPGNTITLPTSLRWDSKKSIHVFHYVSESHKSASNSQQHRLKEPKRDRVRCIAEVEAMKENDREREQKQVCAQWQQLDPGDPAEEKTARRHDIV